MRKVLSDALSSTPSPADLAADHRALEAELFEVAHRVIDERLDDALLSFGLLDQRLRVHMAIEEEGLASLIDPQSAAQLGRDHAALRQLIDATTAALGDRDRDVTLQTLARLAACLGEHADREAERLALPAASVTRASEP